MVPQLVFKVGCIPQYGVDVAHHFNHNLSLLITQSPVFDSAEVIHHLVNMPPIFGKHQFFTFKVVVFVHKRNLGPFFVTEYTPITGLQ